MLDVNPHFCEMLGYTREELLGKTVEEISHPDDHKQICAAAQRLFAQEISSFFQAKRYLRKDGSYFWSNTGVSLVRDANGNPQDSLAVIEERYRKVVEAQTDFILRSLPDTTITFANQSLCQVLGVSPAEIIGRKWSDFANPDDLEKYVLKNLVELSPAQPRFLVENRDQRANGEIGWTQWLNEAIFDQSGQLVEIQSVGRDITKLKNTADIQQVC